MPFSQQGERWFECYVCGLDFPYSKGSRHYLTRRLVDAACNDIRSHKDYLEDMLIPTEQRQSSEQPVSGQGRGSGFGYGDSLYGFIGYGV